MAFSDDRKAAEEARRIKSFVLRWIDEALEKSAAGRRGVAAIGAHDLGGSSHAGVLRDDQMPTALLTTGGRTLQGDLPVASGRKLDGVDLSAFYDAYRVHEDNPNAHHAGFVGLRTAAGQNVDPDAGLRVTWQQGVGTTLRRVNGSTVALDLRLSSPSGLSLAGDTLALDDAVAGAGLVMAGKVLAVAAGAGLQLAGDTVALSPPGSASATSLNSAYAGGHTHAVISSDAPGAARSLLSTSPLGLLTLWQLRVSRTDDATGLTVSRAQGRTTPALLVEQPAGVGVGSGIAVEARVAGAAQPRMRLGDDRIAWGAGGASALDTYLHRVGPRTARLSGDGQGAQPGNLLIDGWLKVGGGTTGTPAAPLTVRSNIPQVRLEHASGTAAGFFDLGVDAGGNLTLAPNGMLYVNPRGRAVLPTVPYDTDLGSITNKFLSVHAAELRVETLVAQQTLATIGGRVLVGPTTQLVEPLASTDTSAYVKHNSLSTNDVLLLEAAGQVEFVRVTGANSNPIRNASFETWDGVSTFTFWSPVGVGTFAQTLVDPANGRAAIRIS